MSTTYAAAASFNVVAYRVNDNESVDELPDVGSWQPKTDSDDPTACWCGFAVVPRDVAPGGWQKIYACRTCRGLNGPNPRLTQGAAR